MRLARKLALALLLGICAVHAVDGALRLSREIALIESDIHRYHHALGRALAAAVGHAWQLEGEGAARALVGVVNQRESEVVIRWVRLDAPAGGEDAPRLATELRERPGVEFAHREEPPEGGFARITTYIPVDLPGRPPTALELTESLEDESRYVAATVARIIAATAAVVCTCGLLALALGVWLIGRPVGALIEKARRIGAGDLEGDVVLAQQDELGELASEINAMCARLSGAQARVAAESAARIDALRRLRHAEKLAMVGTLSAGIAHELGTPLNVCAGRAKEIATGEVDGAEARRSAVIIGERCDRMTQIIRQLLDFARPKVPRKVPDDLRRIARQTASLLEPIAAKRGVVLSLAEGAPVTAPVDAGRIQQVLTNLIVNGIDAMPQGGRITIEAAIVRARPPAEPGGDQPRPEGEYALLRVADEGHGIAPEHRGQIFEPFFTTKDLNERTGLGLPVSQEIVIEHGGFFAVETEPSKGSAFSVYVPVSDDAPPEAARAPRSGEGPPAPAGGLAPLPPPPGSGGPRAR